MEISFKISSILFAIASLLEQKCQGGLTHLDAALPGPPASLG